MSRTSSPRLPKNGYHSPVKITKADGGHTSVRLEPVFIECLKEICCREQLSLAAVVRYLNLRDKVETNFASRLRCFVLDYFKEASTEQGHNLVGHGKLLGKIRLNDTAGWSQPKR